MAAALRRVRHQSGRQEQTQIIASAIGKPAAKAPTIIKVNAESKFTSGRTLSSDMLLSPCGKKPPPGRSGGGFYSRAHVSKKVQSKGAREWLTGH
jgi:hypothetical protein